MNTEVRGYAEGFYGRLLRWPDRLQILDALLVNGFNCYYYAPKEDACHRMSWRVPYDERWRQAFRVFCAAASERGISVVAGVAPGLDFNFQHLDGGEDFKLLSLKSRQLLSDGAAQVSLLMDDIDADFKYRNAGISSEGEAHARLANALGHELDRSIWLTPRIYANELVVDERQYLPDLLQRLACDHAVLFCGSDAVAKQADAREIYHYAPKSKHELILWDNLYANDYCPRRLFIGPWEGRQLAQSVLLNPTGMVYTDCLLLSVMRSCSEAEDVRPAWADTLARHGVPDAFLELSPYFYHPVFNDQPYPAIPEPTDKIFSAIEECLWRWKSPLSREWYAAIFGLKHDLLIARGELPSLRIEKTQNTPLALTLLDKPDKPAR